MHSWGNGDRCKQAITVWHFTMDQKARLCSKIQVIKTRDDNSPLIFIPRGIGEWQFAILRGSGNLENIPQVPRGISGNEMFPFYPVLECPNTVLEHFILF